MAVERRLTGSLTEPRLGDTESVVRRARGPRAASRRGIRPQRRMDMRFGSTIVVLTLAGLVAVAPSLAQHCGAREARQRQLRQHLQPRGPGRPESRRRAPSLLLVGRDDQGVQRGRAEGSVVRHRPLGRRHGRARQPLRVAARPEVPWPTAAAAVGRARAAGAKSQRELDYIAAIETFYKDHDKVEHRTRAVAYEKAMEQLAARYPQDREAAIFYALALNATATPTDKTYAKQLKAAAILEAAFREQPDHPGVAHYLIHSYDYPAIAEKGLGGGPALRDHRARGAPRPAHAVPHLHPAGLLAGLDPVEPRVGRRRRQRLRPLPRLGLPRLRLPPARPGPGGSRGARPDPGGREAGRR